MESNYPIVNYIAEKKRKTKSTHEKDLSLHVCQHSQQHRYSSTDDTPAFTIALTGNQHRYPSTDELKKKISCWITDMCKSNICPLSTFICRYIFTVQREKNSIIMNEILCYVGKWMVLDEILLMNVMQTCRNKYHTFSFLHVEMQTYKRRNNT